MIHWLGRKPLPEAGDCQEIYPALRMGDPDAKQIVIKRHMKLLFYLCNRYSRSYLDSDELVSEALWELVQAVERIAGGALDEHRPKPNIGGYINVCLYGTLNKVVGRKRLMETRLPDMSVGSEWMFNSVRQPYKNLEYKETLSQIEGALTERERHVLDMVLAGCKDPEIGQSVGVTSTRIYQIRNSIKDKIIKLL